ncbi:DEMETER-like protein 2, partial [Bienertia sinuspersici]
MAYDEDQNMVRSPESVLSSILVPPRKPRSLLFRCKRRLNFDDPSLIHKKTRLDDELDLPESSKLQASNFNASKMGNMEESCEPSRGNLKNKVENEPKVLHPESSLLSHNAGSTTKHIRGRGEGKMVAKEDNVKDASVVGPKREKPVIKIHKTKLEVAELSSYSPYYTRSIHGQVLNVTQPNKDQGVSYTSSEHQHNKRVIQKGKKKPSLEILRAANKEWQALMKKAIADSCDTVLENDENVTVEDKSLISHGKVKSFISKVGTIQGQRVYSPWKGSVLDAIIGAFLTQRVSDNFSSSAFMSLGVIFPQDRDCDVYSRHHRMLREQRSNGGRSCTILDKKWNELKLRAKNSKNFDEKKKENLRKGKVVVQRKPKPDWNALRTQYSGSVERERSIDTIDYVDWYAVRRANVKDVSNAILIRGMNEKLSCRIKDLLDRLMLDHGNLDLEWVRNVPPPQAKEFLLSIFGLGLKSVRCVQLLTLKQPAFPVDVNVARVTARLGWIPVPTNTSDKLLMSLLEESSKLHDLISQYLWPRLSKLDQKTLYELHYQMITFGKVFCTKNKPSCAECPMRKECKSYAEIDIEDSDGMGRLITQKMLSKAKGELLKPRCNRQEGPKKKDHVNFNLEDSVEAPKTPLKDLSILERSSEEEKATTHISSSTGRQPKENRTRTQHFVYELPDWHPILEQFDERDPDDSSPYLIIIWESGNPLVEITPSKVPGTVMIPYRTALRGNFPLNGTYFQTNEVFADQQTSQIPIDVRRKTLQQLQRKTLYCGNELSKIVKGLSANEVKSLFNEGYICTRGFDRKTSASVTLERYAVEIFCVAHCAVRPTRIVWPKD